MFYLHGQGTEAAQWPSARVDEGDVMVERPGSDKYHAAGNEQHHARPDERVQSRPFRSAKRSLLSATQLC